MTKNKLTALRDFDNADIRHEEAKLAYRAGEITIDELLEIRKEWLAALRSWDLTV